MSLPDLKALVSHYASMLGLGGWTIDAAWCAPDEMPMSGAMAVCRPLPTRRIAHLLVATDVPPEELRATIAHELCHALLSPLVAVAEQSDSAVMLEEQIVESLALAITRAEATPVDRKALSRALARLPDAWRARVSARTVRARGGVMDPKIAAAAVDALEAGDGDKALSILKGALVAAASSGGEESPPPDAAPDPSAVVAVEEDAPDPGEGDEEMNDDKPAVAAKAEDKPAARLTPEKRARLAIERDAAEIARARQSTVKDAIAFKVLRARAEGLTLKPSVEKRISACSTVEAAEAILDTVRETLEGAPPARARTGAEPPPGDERGEANGPKGRELSPQVAGMLRRQGRADLAGKGRRSAVVIPMRAANGDAEGNG